MSLTSKKKKRDVFLCCISRYWFVSVKWLSRNDAWSVKWSASSLTGGGGALRVRLGPAFSYSSCTLSLVVSCDRDKWSQFVTIHRGKWNIDIDIYKETFNQPFRIQIAVIYYQVTSEMYQPLKIFPTHIAFQNRLLQLVNSIANKSLISSSNHLKWRNILEFSPNSLKRTTAQYWIIGYYNQLDYEMSKKKA